jgi:beta-glucosidase-like glycosyl hydrolase
LLVASVIGAGASVLVCEAGFSLATPTAAGGSASQVRSDLRPLHDALGRLVKGMQAQQRKLGLAHVRIDARQLISNVASLGGGEARLLEELPAVFGLAYTQTFTPLACVDGQTAIGENVLEQVEHGRLATRRGDPATYSFNRALASVGNAGQCLASLERQLTKASSVAQPLRGQLKAWATQLGRSLKLMRRQQHGLRSHPSAASTRWLLRTMASLEAPEPNVLGQFPTVLDLRYTNTYTPLACIATQVALSEDVLREFEQARLNSRGRNPAAYPFKLVLARLRDARACEATLESTLAGAPTSTGGPAPPAPPQGIGTTQTPPTTTSQPQSSTTPIYLDTRYSFAERAADLVSRMTPDEKVAQLRTNSAPAISRLGVQQYTYWSEGQHGINALGADTNSGGVTGGPRATSFPTNFAAAMSWDPSLIYDETTAISDEARGFLDKSLWNTAQNNIGPSQSDYGSLTYFAPSVNMDRDPRWGRTDEAFGEDPYLVSQMAGAFVDGYQGQNLSGQALTPYLKVAATAKHYALNNVEDNRQAISSDTNDTDLHGYYTAQFRSLIENSHVAGLMTSLNAINGTPAMVDTYTANQLARRTYGFDGYSVSDCALSNVYRASPNGHNWAPPGWTTDGQDQNATWTKTSNGTTVSGAAGAQAYALRAGTYLNCPGTQAIDSNIQQAIDAGILSEGVIDSALLRVFTTRMRTGEFDPLSDVAYTKITKDVIQTPGHQALAQKVAENSLVLLKNANVSGTSSPLLPVIPANLNKVVILGDMAGKVTVGSYSGNPSLRVNAVQGITSAVHAANPNASIVFDAAGTSTTATAAATLSTQTQADIKSGDLVIVFVGTDGAVAGEGHDRSGLAMPGNYDSLISQVAALGNPRMALVIQSDGPVAIATDQGYFPAILFSGYNGESQGAALADVLVGSQNPSGHLDFTWYSDDSQLPAMANYGLTPSATGGLGRTYMYFTGTPTYPFGYGLSYTHFTFSNFHVSTQSTAADGSVIATFDVTNSGSSPGAAVAQLYVATPFAVSGVTLPIKRLASFQKTGVLQPGQAQSVSLTVGVPDLAFWDQQNARWVVYDGAYQFQLGYDSHNIAATQTVNVTGALTPHVKHVTVQLPQTVYKPGDTLDLTGKNSWLADDTNHSLEQRNLSVTADNIVEAVNNDGSFVNLGGAQVSYSSSNDKVATISSSGLMRAVTPGVATIHVIVNGVSGSAVVVIKQPLTLDAPPVVAGGSSFTATATLLNTGSSDVKNVNLALTAPSGWTVSAPSPSAVGTVPAGGSVQVSWAVTAPAGTNPGSYALEADASSTDANGAYEVNAVAGVSVPYQSLSAALDNPGISNDSNTTAGNLDGGGLSYSAQALAGDGLTPGAPVSHDGLSFTWPNVSAGEPDNVVAGGQAISLSGSGGTLGFLGTGDYGTASGTGRVVYSDGSTQSFKLSLADWWANSAVAGSDILATTSYVNGPSGQLQHHASVYCARVSLEPGKTVRYVILPSDVSQGGAAGHTAMHIFAMAIG